MVLEAHILVVEGVQLSLVEVHLALQVAHPLLVEGVEGARRSRLLDHEPHFLLALLLFHPINLL